MSASLAQWLEHWSRKLEVVSSSLTRVSRFYQSIIPIMEEINTSSLKYKNKYIPVDKDRIRKANNELRLKRSKPVSEHKNTLDSCMSLKYM